MFTLSHRDLCEWLMILTWATELLPYYAHALMTLLGDTVLGTTRVMSTDRTFFINIGD